MTQFNAIRLKLRDLLFEIEGEEGAKFLLCICDDRAVRRTARKRLIEELREHGKVVTSISAKKASGSLLSTFTEAVRIRDGDCINLWGIPGMRSAAASQIFEELNFHRDTLASFSKPLLVWITSSQAQRLASTAPDFWSRRTAVYFFDNPSAQDLLRRLFARKASVKTKQPSQIEKSFTEILSSEKNLSRCLRRKQQFTPEAADEHIRKLDASLDYLSRQCAAGRQLEVTLWLWNAAAVESFLRFFVNRLEPVERNVYDYVYTDRSEVILQLAEEMPKVLTDYAASVKDKVRQKRRADILKFFMNAAITKLNSVLQDIHLQESRSVHRLPELSDEVLSKEDLAWYERPEKDDPESQAVYDLESWLSGYSTERPKYFSDDEARILKVLYSDSNEPTDVAEIMNLPVQKARQRISELREKVQLYLSGEWLNTNRLASRRSGDKNVHQ